MIMGRCKRRCKGEEEGRGRGERKRKGKRKRGDCIHNGYWWILVGLSSAGVSF